VAVKVHPEYLVGLNGTKLIRQVTDSTTAILVRHVVIGWWWWRRGNCIRQANCDANLGQSVHIVGNRRTIEQDEQIIASSTLDQTRSINVISNTGQTLNNAR
jgi:hypothetical protein